MGKKKDLSVLCVVEETEKRFCIMVRKDLLQKHSDVSPSLIWKTVKISILDTTHTHTLTSHTSRWCCVVQTESLSQPSVLIQLRQLSIHTDAKVHTDTQHTFHTYMLNVLLVPAIWLLHIHCYTLRTEQRLGRQRFGNILSFYRMEGIQNRSWDSVDGKSLSQRKYFMPTQIINLWIKSMFFSQSSSVKLRPFVSLHLNKSPLISGTLGRICLMWSEKNRKFYIRELSKISSAPLNMHLCKHYPTTLKWH